MLKLVWEFTGAKTQAGIKSSVLLNLGFLSIVPILNCHVTLGLKNFIDSDKIQLSLLRLANGKLNADWPSCIKQIYVKCQEVMIIFSFSVNKVALVVRSGMEGYQCGQLCVFMIKHFIIQPSVCFNFVCLKILVSGIEHD